MNKEQLDEQRKNIQGFHHPLSILEGRVVTILSLGTSKQFDKIDPEYLQYFVGILIGVTSSGVWLKQINGERLSWINMINIVSINEEHILDPNNEEDKQTIENIQNQINSQEVLKNQNEEEFDPDSLMELAKKAN